MVFFTCLGCGEAVKKVQVAKHRFQCRRSHTLSCVDCGKDFVGETYQTHLKCVSEDQKYGGKNYVAKANKGEVKQEQWFEQVQRAIDSANSGDRDLRKLLETLRNYPNIPRKEAKFQNFLFSSLRVRDRNLQANAWAAISKAAAESKMQQQPAKNGQPQKDMPSDETDLKRKAEDLGDDSQAKKPKIENGSMVESNGKNSGSIESVEGDTISSFKWRSSIKRYLKSAPENAMKTKRLRKSIIEDYLASDEGRSLAEDSNARDNLKSLFSEKLAKCAETVTIEGKMVRLKC